MKKIHIATIAAAVAATAIVGGMLLTQFNGTSADNTAATFSQNHPSNSANHGTVQNNKAGNNGDNNFGPPDDGGFGGADQLLG